MFSPIYYVHFENTVLIILNAAMAMNTSPNREKNQGAPMDEAAIIQNTPKIIAIRAIRILYIFLIMNLYTRKDS